MVLAFTHVANDYRQASRLTEHGRHKRLFFFYSVFASFTEKAAHVILHLAHTLNKCKRCINARLFWFWFWFSFPPSFSLMNVSKENTGEA